MSLEVLMLRRSLVVFSLVLACFTLSPAPAFAESSETPTAATKLTRGLINTFTGWVEIPKRVAETSQNSGHFAGFTWGIVRGLGYGFIRTAAGLYEVVTFPFPAPPNFEPVIQPEYVFSSEPSDPSTP